MSDIKWFLDLEMTLIESWDLPVLINQDRIKSLGIKEAIIFSFAIWNEKDIDTFNNTMKHKIEQFFDINIVHVLSLVDIVKGVSNFRPIIKDEFDLREFHTKESAFVDFIRGTDRSLVECVLVDDMVEEMEMVLNKEKKIRTINVDDL